MTKTRHDAAVALGYKGPITERDGVMDWHGQPPAFSDAALDAEIVALGKRGIKKEKRSALKEEAVLRMSAEVSALSTFEMVEFLVALWPMLDTASAPANITAVRTIYIYAKQKLTWINGATKAELQAYDPTTD
ncbi:MAG: hypothetical protein GY942_09070, partial [Aestuariibacter sp.]|nr:hypothetical protein [Aestuariibacter sp.]